jgi:hypothetical protein
MGEQPGITHGVGRSPRQNLHDKQEGKMEMVSPSSETGNELGFDGAGGTPSIGADGTSALPVAALQYDADAAQRIPFQMEYQGELYEAAWLFDPFDYKTAEAFELRRNQTLTQASADETDQRDGMVSESDIFEAKVWLFGEKCTGVEGFGEEGETAPDDWQSNFDDQEKAEAVDMYLAGEIVNPPVAKTGKRLPWNHGEEVSTYHFRTIFNGYEIQTQHVLKKMNADQLSSFISLNTRSILVQGRKIGRSQIQIPAKLVKLGHLYDACVMKERTVGYNGRVPLHHKAAVMLAHGSSAQEMLVKNSNAVPE